jgi:hypothetical protein
MLGQIAKHIPLGFGSVACRNPSVKVSSFLYFFKLNGIIMSFLLPYLSIKRNFNIDLKELKAAVMGESLKATSFDSSIVS